MENESTQPIEIPFPDATDRQLRIAVGPCILKLAAGEHTSWVTGTYVDPTGSVPCQVDIDGGNARISQKYNVTRLPSLRGAPIFDLQLGTSAPYALSLDGGANDIRCDFGGLPLNRLDARLGAGQVRFGFASMNPETMEQLHITAGAVDVEVRNLANANAN